MQRVTLPSSPRQLINHASTADLHRECKSGKERQIEHALDQPHACDGGYRRGATGENHAAVRPACPKAERKREENADDRQLADLHADIEAEQGKRERSAW